MADDLPATSLHWMISDRRESIAVESVAEGLRVYENRFGVLTNEPVFPYHEAHASDYMHLTASAPTNVLAPDILLEPYSRGMGAIGLPGDYSSASRFVRAFFAKSNVVADGGEAGEISAFFHAIGAVSTPSGCVRSESGECVRTVYTSCADTDTMTYYFKTYENSRVRAVRMQGENGEPLRFFGVSGSEDILYI